MVPLSVNAFHFLIKPPRANVAFALRTTATALLALLIGMLLGLHYPFWAAMTTIVIARPTRGLVLARGFHRIVGTLIGAAVGTLLLMSLRDYPALLILALAVWVGLCTGAANVIHGQRNYGAVLAAITAALVTLLAFEHPEQALSLDASRVAAVLLGIVVSGVMAALLLPRSDHHRLLAQSRRLTAEALRGSTELLRHGPSEELTQLEQRLIAELAALEGTADDVAAASRLHARLPYVRGLMGSVLALIAATRSLALHLPHTRNPSLDQQAKALAAVLAEAAEAVSGQREAFSDLRAAVRALAKANTGVARDQILIIEQALAAIQADIRGLSEKPVDAPRGPIIRHRDWTAARITALRAFIGIAAIGAIWQLTGWDSGGPMLMSAAIMCGISATQATPASGVFRSFQGAVLAFVAAIICRLYFQPHVDGPLETLLLVAPILLLATLAIANRPTAIAGTDLGMMFLFMLEPGYPVMHSMDYLLTTGTGIVAGVGTIAVVFALVLPLNPVKRLRAMQRELIADLERLAAAPSLPVARKWRALTHHRVLRLVLRAELAGRRPEIAVDGGLAIIAIGNALVRLRRVLRKDALPETNRVAIEAALAAIQELRAKPDAAEKAVTEAAERLRPEAEHDVTANQARSALVTIQEALAANRYFIRYARGMDADDTLALNDNSEKA